MKVKTNLHVGGLFEDAGGRIDAAINTARHYVTKADYQAKVLTSDVVNTTRDVWNSIKTTFSF